MSSTKFEAKIIYRNYHTDLEITCQVFYLKFQLENFYISSTNATFPIYLASPFKKPFLLFLSYGTASKRINIIFPVLKANAYL